MQIILASSSPRRKRLLRKLVRSFSVAPAKIGERVRKGESFPSAAKRLAEKKARAAAALHPSSITIGADTIAYLGGRNFRKTSSEKKARSALRFLSGKTHTVATGVCVLLPSGRRVSYCEKARVRMKSLAPALLDWYLRGGEWKGRAGSYDVSGKGGKLVAEVRGERETAVGLPLRRLRRILAEASATSA
jgi:septum formation protein